MARRYSERQLASVLRSAGAASWQELLDYLAGHVEGLPEADRDEIDALREDLEEMKRRGEPFSWGTRMLYGTIEAVLGAQRS